MVYEELLLIFHIVLQFLDDIVYIDLLYFSPYLVQARQIDLVAFDLDIIQVCPRFEKRLERVDLELFGGSVRTDFFLSGLPVDDEVFVIGKYDTEIRSCHHVEISQFRNGTEIDSHTLEILLSRLLDEDGLGGLEVVLDLFVPFALDEDIEVVKDLLDHLL